MNLTSKAVSEGEDTLFCTHGWCVYKRLRQWMLKAKPRGTNLGRKSLTDDEAYLNQSGIYYVISSKEPSNSFYDFMFKRTLLQSMFVLQ